MASIFRAPIIAPPRARDYPVSLRTIAAAGSLVLLTAAVPPPTIHAYTDLAPTGKHYPVDLRTWTQSLDRTTLFTVQPVPLLGRASTDLTPPSAPYPSDLRTLTRNGALETLYFVAPAPPQTQQLEVTRPAIYPLDLRSIAAAPSLALTTVQVALASKTPITDVQSRPTYPVDLRTTTASLLGSPLNGTPQNYLTRIPNVAPQTISPYPAAFRTWTQNLLQTTLAPTAGAPFGAFDCSVSRQTTFPINLRTYIYYYIIDDNVPPQPADTSVPRTSVYPLSLRTWISTPAVLLASPKPVGSGVVTELPVRRGYHADLRTWISTPLSTVLNPGDTFPIGEAFTELPRAKTYPFELRTQTLDLQQTTLAPPPVPGPNAQHDWPVPRTSVYPIDLRTSIRTMDLRLKDTFFGGPGQPPTNYDWPVPRTSVYPVDLRFWTSRLPSDRPLPWWFVTVNRYINPTGDDVE